jgi:CheY-like chemotaxis protein
MADVRILIADDSPTVRAGLKLLLQYHENWTICGEAEDGQQAVKKAAELKPDVILLDISMPAMDGLSAAEIIRRDAPEAEILIVIPRPRPLRGTNRRPRLHNKIPHSHRPGKSDRSGLPPPISLTPQPDSLIVHRVADAVPQV